MTTKHKRLNFSHSLLVDAGFEFENQQASSEEARTEPFNKIVGSPEQFYTLVLMLAAPNSDSEKIKENWVSIKQEALKAIGQTLSCD